MERLANTKALMGKNGEEWLEAQKIEDKKRKFMNSIRPPNYWNFFEDGSEHLKVKHVLRYNAKPFESYKDGRVEDIMENIE